MITTELNVGELMDYCVDSSIDIHEDYATYLFAFDNNFGASVTKRPGSVGYGRDLWEVTVVKVMRTYGGVNYIVRDETDGYLTDAGVAGMLRGIMRRTKEE